MPIPVCDGASGRAGWVHTLAGQNRGEVVASTTNLTGISPEMAIRFEKTGWGTADGWRRRYRLPAALIAVLHSSRRPGIEHVNDKKPAEGQVRGAYGVSGQSLMLRRPIVGVGQRNGDYHGKYSHADD